MKRISIALIALAMASGVAFAQNGRHGSMNQSKTSPATLKVKHSSQYGAYLVDSQGRALYTIVKEDSPNGDVAQGSGGENVKAEVVPCKQQCLKVWPPLETRGRVRTAGNVDQSKVHTYTRSDGAKQVVYGGYTLYYYARDQRPGQTTGQGVKGFGGTWYLVSPEGEEIAPKNMKHSQYSK